MNSYVNNYWVEARLRTVVELTVPKGKGVYKRKHNRPLCVAEELPEPHSSLVAGRFTSVRRRRVMLGQLIHKWVLGDWEYGSEFDSDDFLSYDQYSRLVYHHYPVGLSDDEYDETHATFGDSDWSDLGE